METPNIDQHFLRDDIWPLIKNDVFIHDRCFDFLDSKPLPGPTPQGNEHIGACEHSQRPELQKRLLAPWINGKSWGEA
jgi:hypothetical protein